MSTIHMSRRFAEWPFPFNEFQCEVLDANMNRGGTGACQCRPEETRRRRGSGGGAPGGWRALVGDRSLLRGDPTRPGHAHAWRTEAQLLWRRRTEQATPMARRLCVRWGRRRKERGTSGMAGWWLEARERASASWPWEHSSAAMAAGQHVQQRHGRQSGADEGKRRHVP